MIHAIVKLKTASSSIVYRAIGFSVAAIEDSARDLAGDEPCGVTVMVEVA